MPTQTHTIRIVIQQQGAAATAAGIRSIATESSSAESALGLLKTALAAVGITQVIREYASLSSQYQSVENRLRLVTRSNRELEATMRGIIRVSSDTFTSFESTSELFARLALNTRDLHVSNERLLVVTRAINEATIISGANFREAHNAIIQLSQGLASGTLRGDELRSVLEQLPAAADVIARELNVDRGALRFLAAEGKVTTEVIIRAFENASSRLHRQFSTMTPTIDQAFSRVKTGVVEAVAELNKATGASQVFARGLVFLAEHVGVLLRTVLAVSVVIGTLYAVTAIGAATAALARMSAFNLIAITTTLRFGAAIKLLAGQMILFGLGAGSIRGVGAALSATFASVQAFVSANPLGALLLVVGAITAAVLALGSASKQTKEDLSGLANSKLLALTTSTGPQASQSGPRSKSVGDFFSHFIGQGEILDTLGISDRFGRANSGGARRDVQINAAGEESVRRLREQARASEEVGSRTQIIVSTLAKELEQERELLDIGQQRGQLEFDFETGIIKITRELKQRNVAFSDLPKEQRKQLEELVRGNAERKIRNKLDQELEDANTALSDQIDLLRVGTREREAEAEALKIVRAFKKAGIEADDEEIERLKIRRQLLHDLQEAESIVFGITGDRAKLEAEIEASRRIQQVGGLTPAQQARFELQRNIDLRQGDTSVEAGVSNGLDRLQLEITDFASLSEKTITDAFHGAEDAIVQFRKTGELNFSGLVDSILDDLTRLLVRQGISALLGLAAGGSGGAAGGIIAGLFAGGGGGGGGFGGYRAGGGDTLPGQAYVVGEKGPEVFKPSVPGSITPNDQLGAGQSGVNVTVVNVDSEDKIAGILASPETGRVIINHIGRNREAAKKQLRV